MNSDNASSDPPNARSSADLPSPDLPFQALADLVHRHALARPSQPALVERDDRLSYAELDALMDRIAASLQRDGVAPRDAIALCASPSPRYAAIFLGALRAGVAVAPLAPSVNPASFASMRDDAQARWLFVDQSALEALGSAADAARCISLDGIAPGLPFAE